MDADPNQSLSNLETDVCYLWSLYEHVKKEKDRLVTELEETKKNLSDSQRMVREWEAKYQHLTMAKAVSISEEETGKAQNRLSKLEREIEKCIALLNE